MCLIVFAINQRPDLPFILIANRDEFHDRETQTAHVWPSYPAIVAGRDARAGGTWLGLHRHGQFAALTNIRAAQPPCSKAPSRGTLVTDFLTSGLPAADWFEHRYQDFERYSGFNMICGDNDSVWFANNDGARPAKLDAGIYGLSNASLDTPWPKVETSKAGLRSLLNQPQRPTTPDYLSLLTQRSKDAASRSDALEQVFVKWPSYGTRCTTVLQRDAQGRTLFTEQSRDQDSNVTDTVSVHQLRFDS